MSDICTKKPRFGSQYVEAFYEDCLKIINTIDVGYFYHVTELKNCTEIIVCNIFKMLIKGVDINYYVFDINSKKWVNLKRRKYSYFTINNLLLIEATSTLYRRFLSDAVNEIMWKRKQYFIVENKRSENQISFNSIKSIVLKKLLKKAEKPNAYLLGKSFMRMIWDVIISKKIHSYCIRIYLKVPELEQYFHVAKMDYESLNRIAKENPNLFPLLAYLNPEDIKQDNLFSKKRWVISDCCHDVKINTPIQFERKSSWNFFKRLSSRIVHGFCSNSQQHFHKLHYQFVIDTLMAVPDICKQKVHVIYFMMIFIFSFNYNKSRYESLTDAQIRVLTNAVFHQVLFFREKLTAPIFMKTFAKGRGVAYEEFYGDLSDILDYLNGNPNVQLRKNKTFTRLLLDARNWEQAISMQKNQKLMNITWHKALIDTVINNYLVKELNTGLEVHQEGQEMHHCIQTYIKLAQDNQYKIFSITTH